MSQATLNGLGISMNSLWNVHGDLQAGNLQRVLPDYDVDDHTALWIVYPKSRLLSPKVRALIDFLVEELKDLPS